MSAVPPTPPEDERADAAISGAPADAPAGECPRCGAPYDAGQEYCLECGLRLPTALTEAGVVSAGPAAGPTFPATWVALVLVFLVIAALGAAAAIAFSRDDDDGATLAATDTPPPAPTTRPATTTPRTGTTRTTRTTRTAPRPRPPQPAALMEWPARDGWTVVLVSLPKAGGLPAAREQAQKAGRAGLPQVGVLESDRHASLHPGYYVVFSGVYDSREDAEAAVAAAASNGYRGAYARQVTS